MAKQTRDTLKSFFQQGDVPTEGNYVDLIDSNLNLSENNTGDIQLTGNVTASGNISASGTTHTLGSTLIGDSGISASNASGTHILGGDLTVSDDLTVGDDLFVTDDIHLGGTNSAHKILQRDSDGNLRIGNDSTLQTGAGNTEIEGLNHITASSDEIKIEATSGLLNLVGNVTASNNISASGIIFGRTGSFDNYANANFGNSDITASAISASGNLSATGDLDIDGKSHFSGSITASGVISASGDITAPRFVATNSGGYRFTTDTIRLLGTDSEGGNNLQIYGGGLNAQGNITASGAISASSRITSLGITAVGTDSFFGSHDNEDKVFIERYSSTYPYAHIDCGGSDNNVEVGFRVDTRDNSGTLGAAFTIDGTAKEATFEGALNAPTLNTGQGDNELYDMDQNVTTTSSPTFSFITLTDIAIDFRPTRDHSGTVAFDQTFDMSSKYGTRLTVTGLPNAGTDQLVGGFDVLASRCQEHTIILATSNSPFIVQPTNVQSGRFQLNLRTGYKSFNSSDFPSGIIINIAFFGV